MKRFYKTVTLAGDKAQGFMIALDGKAVKTPARQTLLLPREKLAAAVAEEWDAQTEKINPETMPLTQLCTTALDIVPGSRPQMSIMALSYLDTDLLCYRAPETEPVAACQAVRRDPFLAWFAGAYGAPLATTTGLSALQQDRAIHKAVQRATEAYDDWHFTAFQILVPLTGSVVLALALMDSHATPSQIYDAVNAEEDYKAEIYNEACHGPAPQQEKRQDAMMRDLKAAQDFLTFLKACSD